MITLDESNWYFNKFSPLLLLKVYSDNKWEFEFWYSGLKHEPFKSQDPHTNSPDWSPYISFKNGWENLV